MTNFTLKSPSLNVAKGWAKEPIEETDPLTRATLLQLRLEWISVALEDVIPEMTDAINAELEEAS